MNARSYLTSLLLASALPLSAAPLSLLPDRVPVAVTDRQEGQIPDRIQLGGWVGERVLGNETNRLLKVPTDRLLEGYRQRPGRQTWDGEHVGKWLHAATLAWAHSGDSALRGKVDETVAELMKCQLKDGYLGTYTDDKRWTEWDVWAHKYNLLGLLTYMRYTGNRAPLETCRRMGDYLCKNLGDGSGQRDIITAGSQHVGMASTSVMEPMVLLYRLTGEQRYLRFCHYILRAWEQPNGPHVLSRLLDHQGVDKVGNGKAYEMLSCLNGALELYRTEGDRRLLDICLHAWQDIVDKRLYLTGASSIGEHFLADHHLPNSGNIGETCVTVTWLQFNVQLLRLTGEARFAGQLEQLVYNQLFGAQQPDCSAWGYYVQMEGRKPYSSTLDGHCCLSSGPRGVALIPTFAVSTDSDGVVVNLYAPGRADLALRDGTAVTLVTETAYPRDSRLSFTVQTMARQPFALKLPIPAWSRNPSLAVNGDKVDLRPGADGYVAVQRVWQSADRVELTLPLKPRLIVGEHTNAGKFAFAYGPLILAADETLMTGKLKKMAALVVPEPDLSILELTGAPAPAAKDWPGSPVFHARLGVRSATAPGTIAQPVDIGLVPFADAGRTGGAYAVWLPGFVAGPGFNLSRLGEESISRPYPAGTAGALHDDSPATVANAYDDTLASEDWFAVTLAEPVAITRVGFCQGLVLAEHGGWFDTSAGKPRIQVQREHDGPWETVGELADYPATDATTVPALSPEARFVLTLPGPIRAVAVRVIGAPSRGAATTKSLASCGELQVYLD